MNSNKIETQESNSSANEFVFIALGLLICVAVVVGGFYFFGTMKGEWHVADAVRSYSSQQRVDAAYGYHQSPPKNLVDLRFSFNKARDAKGVSWYPSSTGEVITYDNHPELRPKPLEAIRPDGTQYRPE